MGEGVIIGQIALAYQAFKLESGLDSLGISLSGYDKFPKDGVGAKDFLEEKEEQDIVVMNPPFSNKYAFIDKALEIARITYCLLPLDTCNYNYFARNYLIKKTYWGRVTMTPKLFLHDGTETRRGGNSSYAWFEFRQTERQVDAYEKFLDLEDFGL
jgi:hypothetical protein